MLFERKHFLVAIVFGLILGFGGLRTAFCLTIFSSGGYQTPESISLSNDGLSYLIPDANGYTHGPIWQVPLAGGPPSVFSSPGNSILNAGLFLPVNFGSTVPAGSFATFGTDTGSLPGSNGVASFYGSVGGPPIQTVAISNSVFVGAVWVSSFGSFSGDVMIASANYDQTDGVFFSSVVALNPNNRIHPLSIAIPLPSPPGAAGIGQADGITQAPSNFGAFGGDLLVDDADSGTIDAITSTGTILPFANIPLRPGELGLREMSISPSDFLPGQGNDLIVSISASSNGGGAFGELVALDSSGNIVGSIAQGTAANPFDPRGTYFTSGGDLLIANTDSGIDLATSADFVAGRAGSGNVPEPSGAGLLGIAAGLLCKRRRRNKNHFRPRCLAIPQYNIITHVTTATEYVSDASQ